MRKDISVIIRTCNSEKYLKETLDSITNQTLSKRRYEIIIIDNDSTDRTLDIVDKYNNIRLIRTHISNHITSINFGILDSTSKYIILVDSDDIIDKNLLKEMLKNISNVAYVYSDYYELINGEYKLVSLRDNKFNSIACGILFRRETLEDVGLYDDNLVFPEYDVLMKLEYYSSEYIQKPLYTYRRHNTNMSLNKHYINVGLSQLKERYGNDLPHIRDY